MWSHQNHPSTKTHNGKRSHKHKASPRGARSFCPTSGTLTLGTCPREISPSEYPALKTNGVYGQKTQKSVQKGKTFKSSRVDSLTWIQHKNNLKSS